MRRFIPIIHTIIVVYVLCFAAIAEEESSEGHIRRLTHSGNNVAKFPCLSSDGQSMLYTLEIKENEEESKAIRFLNIPEGTETELFRDGRQPLPTRFAEGMIRVGSKPPLLSGDGKIAVFTLSLDGPLKLQDHFLAVVPTDGSEFWMTSFPIQNLSEEDIRSYEFTNGDWERVANCAISEDGSRIVCLVKGHLGPRQLGSSSGIILLDTASREQTTLLAPEFNADGWFWSQFPRFPATGGGWAFCMSGDGQTIVFGARTSEDTNDYDLYMADWNSRDIARLTDFSDRWFSLADITQDGRIVLFFYNGRKKEGIGSYRIDTQEKDTVYLESKDTPRIEFFDMSGNGRFTLFKNIYLGKRLDLRTGNEIVAFSDKSEGYIQGIAPMDFPHFPSFWRPQIMSASGEKILLVGPPLGKDSPEIYLLTLDSK